MDDLTSDCLTYIYLTRCETPVDLNFSKELTERTRHYILFSSHLFDFYRENRLSS